MDAQLEAKLAKFGEFTPEERDCISEKVPMLVDEGMDQDQAVAVAISKCAPDKRRSAKMSSATHTPMGYRATMADGELTIHSVPIFVECKRGDVTFDGKWIASAVAHAKQAEREGYLPPLHIRHHEPSTEANNAVRAAGFFRVLGTGVITFKGARRTAVLADLIITDPRTQEEVLAKRLPYRSVEIFDVEKPSIDGLALLDHEAPFLELPMLMVSEVADGAHATHVADATFSQPWRLEGSADGGPMVACFRRNEHAHLLFREDAMTQTTTEGIDTSQQALLFQDDKSGDDKPKEKDKDKSEDMQEDGGGGMDISAVVKAIKSGSISVKDMDAILAAIQEARTEAAPPEEAPAPAAVPGAESMQKDTMDDKVAALHGANEALRAKVDAMEAETQRDKDVAAAMTKLKDRPLGADLETRLMTFHKEHGPKAFAAYVDGIANTIGTLSPDDDRAEAFLGQTGKVPDVAMKYQDQGTDAIDRAASYAREWEVLRETGHARVTLERYVEINMARDAS